MVFISGTTSCPYGGTGQKTHKSDSGMLEIRRKRDDLLTLIWISKKRDFPERLGELHKDMLLNGKTRLDEVARNTDHEIFHLNLRCLIYDQSFNGNS